MANVVNWSVISLVVLPLSPRCYRAAQEPVPHQLQVFPLLQCLPLCNLRSTSSDRYEVHLEVIKTNGILDSEERM